MLSTRFPGCLWLPLLLLCINTAPLSAQESSLSSVAHLIRNANYDVALDSLDQIASDLNLPSAVQFAPSAIDPLDADSRTFYLYRALAHEKRAQYVAARNYYQVFLALEPMGARADTVRLRLPYVRHQAARMLMRTALSRPDDLAGSFSPEGARHTIGILPFRNVSDVGIMDQFGYASGGYLQNSIGMLDSFANPAHYVVDRASIQAVFDTVALSAIYFPGTPLTPTRIGKILGAEYVVTGTVDAVVGNVLVRPLLTVVSADTTYELIPLNSTMSAYTAQGARNVQRDLAIRISDQLQQLTGFEYTPNRFVYSDSLDQLAFDNINPFLAYGAAVEQVWAGLYDDAIQIMEDAVGPPLGPMDIAGIEALKTHLQGPPDEGLNLLEADPVIPEPDPVVAIPEDTTATPELPPDQTDNIPPESQDTPPSTRPSMSLSATQMLINMGNTALGLQLLPILLPVPENSSLKRIRAMANPAYSTLPARQVEFRFGLSFPSHLRLPLQINVAPKHP